MTNFKATSNTPSPVPTAPNWVPKVRHLYHLFCSYALTFLSPLCLVAGLYVTLTSHLPWSHIDLTATSADPEGFRDLLNYLYKVRMFAIYNFQPRELTFSFSLSAAVPKAYIVSSHPQFIIHPFLTITTFILHYFHSFYYLPRPLL